MAESTLEETISTKLKNILTVILHVWIRRYIAKQVTPSEPYKTSDYLQMMLILQANDSGSSTYIFGPQMMISFFLLNIYQTSVF